MTGPQVAPEVAAVVGRAERAVRRYERNLGPAKGAALDGERAKACELLEARSVDVSSGAFRLTWLMAVLATRRSGVPRALAIALDAESESEGPGTGPEAFGDNDGSPPPWSTPGR